jgi:membrane associated rhomboid family serine protease
MANFRIGSFPPVTSVVKNLIIINVLVFALTYVLARQGVDLDAYLALHYWQSPLFKWWQLVTHLFMHGSVEHIFFNMFGLYMFGSILENVWGPKKFLIFYLICGVGAAAFYLGVLTFEYTSFQHAFMAYQQQPTYEGFIQFVRDHPRIGTISEGFSRDMWSAPVSIEEIHKYYTYIINEPTVGASGAIFGLLFAFAYLFPNLPLMIMFIPIPVKAKWLVTGYGLIELFSGFRNAADDNVAHFAHLGGMLFAFILLRLWNNKSHNRFY